MRYIDNKLLLYHENISKYQTKFIEYFGVED